MLNRRPRRLMNQMNVVPYIDVMLVLLVIFMVTAPMFTPGVIDVPSVSHAKSADARPIEVIVNADGTYKLSDEGESHTLASLDELKQAAPSATAGDRPVAVSAGKDLKYDAVVQVVNALHEAGVKKVALVVKTAK
ncbi:ExbD/TolR family protein [Crenobacter sp. SG2305]|uniref:ExbD/TolR family protein n=1 Tax=Crenobacter oryzisoli TaxID=3056844 RepID=UPI0025AB1E58|nr:ExbD/TolR family protein [Crenobacter sp. SG2305]MDN0083502.1 ExbD/TolR family protein [Crenobacter sp. SG2305]